jgi:hypothetical protein
MIKQTLRMVAAAAIAATLLATPSSSAEEAPGAARLNYAVPEVGDCHRLALRQVAATSDPKPTVSCDSKHTLVTIAVKRLSGSVDWDDKLALQNKIGVKCERGMRAALGRNDKLRSQTAYLWFWFIPTPAQIKQGAKWLRCDMGLSGATKLMPLPTDVRLGSKLPDRVARCLDARAYATACARPHVWRATGAFRLAGPRPDERRARAAARRGCPRFTTGVFRYSGPGLYEWKAGSRSMVCYDESTR